MAAVDRDEVHEALAQLYDDAELGRTALASRISEVRDRATLREASQRLRALLQGAIEALRPARRYAFGSLESRSYDVLSLRYVENRGLPRMAEELSLSQRQIHRDLALAERKLAALLSSSAVRNESRGLRGQLEDELLALRSQPTQVPLEEATRSAADLIAPLADRLGVRLNVRPGFPPTVAVLVERALLTQVLAQLLCCAIQMAASPEVTVTVETSGSEAALIASFSADPARFQAERYADAQRIAAAQQMRCELSLDPPESARIVLRLNAGRPTSVLVVEDNPGAVELYRRYLSAGSWQAHSVSDPRKALELASGLRPDVIILDIMMPSMDGWTVLRELSSRPETAAIPVIVCSVVQDVQLSQALGAREHLCKPVSQGKLLAALSRCLGPRRVPQ